MSLSLYLLFPTRTSTALYIGIRSLACSQYYYFSSGIGKVRNQKPTRCWYYHLYKRCLSSGVKISCISSEGNYFLICFLSLFIFCQHIVCMYLCTAPTKEIYLLFWEINTSLKRNLGISLKGVSSQNLRRVKLYIN